MGNILDITVAPSLDRLEGGPRWAPCGAPDSVEARSRPGSCGVADWRPLSLNRLLEGGGAR